MIEYASTKDYEESEGIDPCKCGKCESCLNQLEYQKHLEEDRLVDKER